jgi:cation diffusion facilitator CzcD-associated flavoprotein CzcO
MSGANGYILNSHADVPDLAVAQAAVPLNVIIVGAGIGGLAAAIALARHGHSITVLEQAPELGEVTMQLPISVRAVIDYIYIRLEQEYKYPLIQVVSC